MNILFLHGALASKNQFDDIIKGLPENYACHALNFSGHGGKFIPMGGLNFETFCKDILDYLEEKKIEKINLFGYSMGGYAALLFASKFPDRVEKIFTLNVKFTWDLESTLKQTDLLNPDKMLEKVPLFANNLMLLHGVNLWKDLLHQTSTMMNDLSQNKHLEKEDFEKLNMPCRLGIGELDQTSSIQETIEVKNMMTNASLLVIPQAPHAFEKIPVTRIVFEITSFF